jgi:hypothetical protein
MSCHPVPSSLQSPEALMRGRFSRKKKNDPPPNVHMTSAQYLAIQDQLWQLDLVLDRVRKMLREASGESQ